MTMEDATNLFHYWRKVPPVAEIVFYALGGKPGEEPKAQQQSDPGYSAEQLKAMAAMMNGAR